MSRLAALVLLGSACGPSTPAAPSPPAPTSVPSATPVTAHDTSPTGLCSRLCAKALRCLGVGDTELAACTASCAIHTPDRTKVEQLEAGDCDQVLTVLGKTGGGCTADCRGCASDGTRCDAVAGGANRIPCDPCCCAPGGAPAWKTE